jgi:acetyltransferase-like isoleucine patch superfamily enzyme
MNSSDPTLRIADDVELGRNVKLPGFCNLYGCTIGDDTLIGTFVEIQKNAVVGARCKIQSHSFVCEGVTIEDEVFVSHGVMFINDLRPRATNRDGTPKGDGEWTCTPTRVRRRATIGTSATILAGVTIGEEALVAAGAVVTHDVPPRTLVAGTPARVIRPLEDHELE